MRRFRSASAPSGKWTRKGRIALPSGVVPGFAREEPTSDGFGERARPTAPAATEAARDPRHENAGKAAHRITTAARVILLRRIAYPARLESLASRSGIIAGSFRCACPIHSDAIYRRRYTGRSDVAPRRWAITRWYRSIPWYQPARGLLQYETRACAKCRRAPPPTAGEGRYQGMLDV